MNTLYLTALGIVIVILIFIFAILAIKKVYISHKKYHNDPTNKKQLLFNYKKLRKESYYVWDYTGYIGNNKTGIYVIYLKERKHKGVIPVYVGQSVDILRRWNEHKKGLEEAAQGYKANVRYNKMYAYAKDHHRRVEDFRFVFIEECSKKELDNVEVNYINVFDSNIRGFNLTAGNTKNKDKNKK